MTTRSKKRSAVILNTRRTATFAVLATALLPAGASASYSDLRSPDARDAARASEMRDYQDLRSPDARDAGRPAQTPSPATSSGSSGFDWDAPATAGGGVLVFLALGGTALVSRRRGETRRTTVGEESADGRM